MHICSSCGYESPGSARFCRQCGVPLLAEHNVTEATTRNFGRQDFPSAPPKSAPLPPPAEVAGMNAPRYQQPLQASPPAYAPAWTPHAPNTASLKSKSFFQRWGALTLALLIGAGIGGAVNEAKNKGRVRLSSQERAILDNARREAEIARTMTGAVNDMQERLANQIEKFQDEVERAADEAERSMERGLTGIADVAPLDLSEFEYAGATARQTSLIPGREMLKQTTKDDFQTVSDFYQKKLGKPYLQQFERNARRTLFQLTGPQSVTVLIQESRERSRPTEILVVRSPFRFPPLPGVTAKPGADAPQPGVAAKPSQNVVP